MTVARLARQFRAAGQAWRRGAGLLVALAVGAALSSPLQAGPGLSVDAGDFPLVRIFSDAAGSAAARPGVPAITENGTPVVGAAPLDRSTPLPLHLALLVDTSGSMAAAMEAVRHAAVEAVQRLNDADTLALIGFSDDVRVLAAPTRDRQALGQAIGTLQAAGGTALYDAIKAGVAQVRDAGGSRRAVVLLTDGKDESTPGNPGSAMRLEPLKALLAEAGVPVYVLALGNDVDLGVLQDIAGVSGGQVYSAARPDALGDLFRDVFADLRGSGGWRYISPDLSVDGGRRIISLTLPTGQPASATYLAPKIPGVAWRYTRTAEAGSLCSAAALAPDGHVALIPDPLTLVQDNGALLATQPGDAAPAQAFDRMAIGDGGAAYGFTQTGGSAFTLTPSDRTPGAPWLVMRQAAPAGTPGAPVAVSPSGGTTLWFQLPAGTQRPTFTARRGEDATALWSRTICPFSSCDSVTGAAVADDGSALLNLTGVLQRYGADGKPAGTRRETFFPQIGFSADGKLAAGVVWQPAPKRALLMDAALRTVATLDVRSYLDSVPAVVAVSPDGRWFAARDDFQVQRMEVATHRMWSRPLSRLRPAASCALTLAVDNAGRVLTGDGASVFLLSGPASQ